MKKFKKLSALLIAAVMVFAMAMPAMADATKDGHIKITGLNNGDKVTVYQIATIDDNGNITAVDGVTVGLDDTFDLNAKNPKAAQIQDLVKEGKGEKVEGPIEVTGTYDKTNIPYGIYVATIEPKNAENAAEKTLYNPVLLATYMQSTGLKVGEIAIDTALYGDEAVAKKTTTKSYKEIKDGVIPDNAGNAVDGNDEDEQTPLANEGPAATAGMKTLDNRDDVITYRMVIDKPDYPSNAENKTMYAKDILQQGIDYCDANRSDVTWADVKVNGWSMKAKDGKYFFYVNDDETKAPAAELIPAADKKSFEIVFDYDQVPDKFDVVYYGRLNDQCYVGHKPNTNTMEYYYAQDTTQGGTWKPGQNKPAGDLAKITDTEDVYTYRVELIKKDQDGNALAGATFKLQVKNGDNWEDVAGESGLVSGADGVVRTNNTVAKGTYRFVETAAPQGYSFVEGAETNNSQPIEANWVSAKFSKSETNYTSNITEAQDYDATKNPQAKQVGWIKGGEFFSTKPEGEEYDGTNGETAEVFPAYVKSINTYYEEVTNPDASNPAGFNFGEMTNTKTPELPSTGGMGTYIFTIVGVALIGVAASLLIFKRRKDA